MKTLLGTGILAMLLLAGCASGNIGMLCPISGGETITVILTPRGPLPAENDDFEVLVANILPKADKKQLIYSFDLLAKKGKAPQHVTVDDVSEEKPELMVDDAEPKLVSNRFWRKDAAPKSAEDPRLAWLHHEGNSTRVFRFTIITDDGRRLVMYQATIFPVFLKMAAQKVLGIIP